MRDERTIDGIYRQGIPRRSPERRLVVAPRIEKPAPTPVIITDIHPPVSSPPQPAAPGTLVALPTPRPAIAPMGPTTQPSPTAAPDALPQHVHAVTPKQEKTPLTASLNKEVNKKTIKRAATKSSKLMNGVVIGLIVLVLSGTGFLGWQTWHTNTQAQEKFSDGGQSSSTTATTSSAAPDEAPVSNAAKQAYTVAADLPRTISIDRVNIHARVLRMSVGNDGAIEAPKGIWDTGWYDGSAKPGEPGNVFIDGHVSGPTMDAVFVKLKVLHAGDYITVQRGDGTQLTYAVSTVSTVKVGDINMRSVLAGPTGVKESLTLMTCGGGYQGNYSYDSRVIVVAKRVS